MASIKPATPSGHDVAVRELAPGVWSYAQHDGSWWVNSTGFILAEDRTILIDTCSTERRTRDLLAEVARHSPRPVTTVINTHSHGDHTYGNGLTGASTIIGHPNCRDEMMRDTLLAEPPLAFDPVPDWGNVTLAPPNLTVADRIDVHADSRLLQVQSIGVPAHTTGDLVVWLAEYGVLFTGDLVFNGGTPLLMFGSVVGYLTALERLASFGAETLVPGHGEPCGPRIIDPLHRYAEFVLDKAADGRRRGQTPAQVAAHLSLGEFDAWLDPERIVLNLHRAYADLDAGEAGSTGGTPTASSPAALTAAVSEPSAVDIPSAFADAVAHHGGPLRCIA
jgi:cyclase